MTEIAKSTSDFDGLKADSSDAQRDAAQLSSFFVGTKEPTKCYKSLSYSGYNPVPAIRRLQGDCFYLDFVPLESELAPAMVCASVKGFYITQTKQGKFNPVPVASTGKAAKAQKGKDAAAEPAANPSCLASTLSGCLGLYSAKFKKQFELAVQAHYQEIAYESGPAVFPANAWLARPSATNAGERTHEFDLARSEYDLMKFTETAVISSSNGRDWNEERQQARELPRRTIAQRIDRDRAMYRTHAEYMDAVRDAAMAIFNGQVMPLNPTDASTSWIYIHNNIFFTRATDMRGIYSDCGGDETFEKSISNDIVVLQRLYDIENSPAYDGSKGDEDDSEDGKEETNGKNSDDKLSGSDEAAAATGTDIYTTDNVLIRYCGQTLLAQTIVPGLFNGLVSGESTIAYGSLEGQGVATDASIHAKIGKVANKLYLKEHKVTVKPIGIAASEKSSEATSEAEPSTLYTSADIKGIVGSDNRTYLLDLGHMFPRDGNFSDDKYPTAVFRPELLQAYISRSFVMARAKAVTEKRAELLKQKAEVEAKGEKFVLPENLGLPEVPIPTLSMNPDLYVRGVELKDDAESIDADKKLNIMISRFLTDECIPRLINDWVSGNSALPIDSASLTSSMHARGINMRYLGSIAKAAIPVSPALRDVLFREMIVRSATVVFRRLASTVAPYSTAEFVVSFLNAFFDSLSNTGKGSRSGVKPLHLSEPQATSALTAKDDAFGLSHHSLWAKIRLLVESKYSFTLPEFIPGTMFEVSTLRAICLRIGIKVEAKNYDFLKEKIFTLNDLVEMVPVIKHVVPNSRDGNTVLSAGRTLLEEGREDGCIEAFHEALNIFNQTHGMVHRDVASTFSSLAIAYFHAGDASQAVDSAERAVSIFEKTCGADHHDTINAYATLSTLAAAALQFDVARNFVRRALYLSIVSAGFSHADSANAYVSLALLQHDSQQYAESMPVLAKAQRIVDNLLALTATKDMTPELELAINGGLHAISASVCHLLAVAHAAQNQFRDALMLEKKNYSILQQLKISQEDPRWTEANQWLAELTRRAVEFEKSNASASKLISGKKGVDSRLGGKKGVNTKLLKTTLDTASSLQKQQDSSSAKKGSAASIKRAPAARAPAAVIGKASSSAAPAPAPAAAKKSKTPVPDLL